jgi:hypothetical protein
MFLSEVQSLNLISERCTRTVIAVEAKQSVTKILDHHSMLLSSNSNSPRDVHFNLLFMSPALAQ